MIFSSSDELVEALLDRFDGATPYSRQDLRLALHRFVPWAHRVDGTALDPELMFTRRNIERFVQSGLSDYKPASRNNIRSRLLRISEPLLDPEGRNPRLRPIAPASPLSPYSRSDIAALNSWASTQSTRERRRNARVLLSLGLGAGLSAAEIAEARTADVHYVHDGCTVVFVRGSRSREVPVLLEWAAVLGADRNSLQSDQYLFRPGRTSSWPNLITNFTASAPGATRPQSQRMRSTWIVTQLSAGTNVRALVRAAGVDSLEAFTRYLAFVNEPHPEATQLQLVNAFTASASVS